MNVGKLKPRTRPISLSPETLLAQVQTRLDKFAAYDPAASPRPELDACDLAAWGREARGYLARLRERLQEGEPLPPSWLPVTPPSPPAKRARRAKLGDRVLYWMRELPEPRLALVVALAPDPEVLGLFVFAHPERDPVGSSGTKEGVLYSAKSEAGGAGEFRVDPYHRVGTILKPYHRADGTRRHSVEVRAAWFPTGESR